jgi:predicted ATPase
MAIVDFRTQGYRSIKDLWLKMQPVNVITGKNGTGKSNLYRAMYLISCAASGQLASALADEGGISAALWAGEWSSDNPRTMSLSMRSGNFEYNLVCGYAGEKRRPSFFDKDPVIKKEEVFDLTHRKRKQILDRRIGSVFVHNSAGKKVEYTKKVSDHESILAALHDPVSYPELFALREEIRGWRFYHHFRSDPDSPLRLPQIGVLTAALSHDGKDLAAALATIIETGDRDWLESAIDEAFPGSTLGIVQTEAGLTISFFQPGLLRPFTGVELSDGTLQYLCLLAALLSLTPPPVMVLNEPETSLHPNLIAPLARLIAKASNVTQIWLTTHSRELADAIMDATGYEPYELTKKNGQTKLVGAGLGGYREDDDDQENDEDD